MVEKFPSSYHLGKILWRNKESQLQEIPVERMNQRWQGKKVRWAKDHSSFLQVLLLSCCGNLYDLESSMDEFSILFLHIQRWFEKVNKKMAMLLRISNIIPAISI